MPNDDTRRASAGRRPPLKKSGSGTDSSDAAFANETDRDDSVVEGRNAVIEALRAGVQILKVFIAKDDGDKTLGFIASAARSAGAAVVEVDRKKLNSMSAAGSHQGVIARIAAVPYVTVGDILGIAKERGEEPLVIVCDGITDPHNLGAVIRTGEALGAHGIIIPRHRSAGLSVTVARTSSGAVYHMAVACVPNLVSAIKELKDAGLWIYGAYSDGGTPLWELDVAGAAAFVIGSEGGGVGRLVGEHCDFKVRIPMFGKTPNLNASVSAAILMYEAVRQRRA